MGIRLRLVSWVLGACFWVLVMRDSRFEIQDSGFRIQDDINTKGIRQKILCVVGILAFAQGKGRFALEK